MGRRVLATLWGMAAAILYTSPGITVRARAPKTPEAKFLLAWGKKGDAPGEFYSPIGIAVNTKDEVFVTDLNNARVQKFSSSGEHRGGFDLPRDTPERRSSQAGGIAVDEKGQLYLTFMAQH